MKMIASLQHPLIKHLVKLREKRSYRYEQKSLIIEGRKLVSEVPAKLIITTNVNEPLEAEKVILVSDAVMKKISSAVTPEGIVAEVEMPDIPLIAATRLLALDCINDPGNLGVLLRTALAFGWDGAFLLNGCADPFNSKALTAARGATFKLPLIQGSWDKLSQLATQFSLTPYVADIEGKELNQVTKGKTLLVLGNEANGPSDETLKRCQPITIPMTNKMESLNVAVAGGILMYTL